MEAPSAADRDEDALGRAFRYLGHRDRTEAEVRGHLERAHVAAAAIDRTIERLHDDGYLDDARFAQRFTEERRALDAWGSERIERRLRDLGVDDELIAAALADGSEAELDSAVALLRQRFAAPPADARDRHRALGMLLRKGYELELAYDAVRALERDAA